MRPPTTRSTEVYGNVGLGVRIHRNTHTHLDVHVAAALDAIGGVLGVESFVTTPKGYTAMLEWMSAFGTISKVGVEGTGAYGAGLGRFLARAGIEVVEVDRPNRQVRRAKGKSDPADAVEAARAVLSGRCTGAPSPGTATSRPSGRWSSPSVRLERVASAPSTRCAS